MEASIGVNLRVTAHSNQGGRKYMEDMFCVAYQPTSDERDLLYAYFGIFDGHGGKEAAMYAKTHLMDHIVSQKNFWSDDDELVKRAIHDGFLLTHHAMWKEIEKWPRTASGLPSTSGTTASIVFVRRGKMYIGHVGDSAIILGLQDVDAPCWRAEQLTKDHKPENKVENARIERCGGKVVCKSGVPRVVWNRPRIGHKGPVRRSTHIDEIPFLAVARSLGDLWSYNAVTDEFVVSPEPDVTVIEIDVSKHRCIILGSDGLWNMVNPQDAVNSVFYAERNNERQLLISPPDVSACQVQNWINPSKRLVDRALDRWLNHNLRADNTSVVTVVIDPPGPPKAQVLRQNQNRTHVARQSVSSVVDPDTSKTVPAMVLDPIPGLKPSASASPFAAHNIGNRNFMTPVSSFTNYRTDSRAYGHSNDEDRASSRSYSVPSSQSAERYKSCPSNDSKTRRILMKRKIVPSATSNANSTLPSSSPSSSSSNTRDSKTDKSLNSQYFPRAENRSVEQAKECYTEGLADSASVDDPHQSRDNDVQINEISSSSEGSSSSNFCGPRDTPDEPQAKRSRIVRAIKTPATAQRPHTRLSSVRTQGDAAAETPTSTLHSSCPSLTTAPPVAANTSRQTRSGDTKKKPNSLIRKPPTKSLVSVTNPRKSKSLQRRKVKRVTRSMKKTPK